VLNTTAVGRRIQILADDVGDLLGRRVGREFERRGGANSLVATARERNRPRQAMNMNLTGLDSGSPALPDGSRLAAHRRFCAVDPKHLRELGTRVVEGLGPSVVCSPVEGELR
jgi:hypothetical protein